MTNEAAFRAVTAANIALCLPIGLYFRVRSLKARERLDRRQEGWPLLVGLRLCGLSAWVVAGAYLAGAGWLARWAVPLPVGLRVAGAALSLTAVPALLFWTFRSLGANLTDTVVTRREHTLITHGPYRWVRHPFYGVVALWGLALSLVTANGLLALLGAGALALLATRTRTEEAKLAERFGESYRAYAARTGRFLPHLRR